MGHKVNPTGIRLGVIKEHNSVWYADKKDYAKNLLNDIQVREFLVAERGRYMGGDHKSRRGDHK